MPVKIDPVVKPQFQSPEQKSDLSAKSGGNTYQTTVSLVGGGAVASIVFVVIGVLGYMLLRTRKTLNTAKDEKAQYKDALSSCIYGIETTGHASYAKKTAKSNAEALGVDQLLSKEVDRICPK
jgi:hypothetical protein